MEEYSRQIQEMTFSGKEIFTENSTGGRRGTVTGHRQNELLSMFILL